MITVYKKFFLMLGVTVLLCLSASIVWSETMDDLVSRGDYPNHIYYKKFSDVPFTGKIEGNEKGSFKDGKFHGQWVGYHKNGQLWYKKNYKNGKIDGHSVNYYENGKISEEGYYVLGNENGLWTYFFSSGKLLAKHNYNNGKRHGLWLSYSPDGSLIQRGEFKNDKREGFWLDANPEGVIDKKNTGSYKNGKKVSN